MGARLQLTSSRWAKTEYEVVGTTFEATRHLCTSSVVELGNVSIYRIPHTVRIRIDVICNVVKSIRNTCGFYCELNCKPQTADKPSESVTCHLTERHCRSTSCIRRYNKLPPTNRELALDWYQKEDRLATKNNSEGLYRYLLCGNTCQ